MGPKRGLKNRSDLCCLVRYLLKFLPLTHPMGDTVHLRGQGLPTRNSGMECGVKPQLPNWGVVQQYPNTWHGQESRKKKKKDQPQRDGWYTAVYQYRSQQSGWCATFLPSSSPLSRLSHHSDLYIILRKYVLRMYYIYIDHIRSICYGCFFVTPPPWSFLCVENHLLLYIGCTLYVFDVWQCVCSMCVCHPIYLRLSQIHTIAVPGNTGPHMRLFCPPSVVSWLLIFL